MPLETKPTSANAQPELVVQLRALLDGSQTSPEGLLDEAALQQFLEEARAQIDARLAQMEQRNRLNEDGELVLDGDHLSIEDALKVARGELKVCIAQDTREKVVSCREAIMARVEKGERIYGFDTGFGQHQDIPVSPENIARLQLSLTRSHAIGVGEPAPREVVRLAMLFRINALIKGYSGISPEVVNKLIEVLNNGRIVPWVPKMGSLGASGDLAPLSHIALNLIGEGECYHQEDDGSWQLIPAAEALKREKIDPAVLGAKDGLALNNGMQFSTAYLTYLMDELDRLVTLSTVFGACATEIMMGSDTPFTPGIQELRPHPGQARVAKILHEAMEESGIRKSHESPQYDSNVQDPYSSRCLPQAIGPFFDMQDFVREVIRREMNAATDNPVVINGQPVSGGNFHGEPIAISAAGLFNAFCAVMKIAEARVRRLVDAGKNRLGISCLIDPKADHETSSGMMIVEYTIHAIINRILSLNNAAFLASASSASGQEDHVSHAPTVILNLEQAMDLFRTSLALELAMLRQGYYVVNASEAQFKKENRIPDDASLTPGKAGKILLQEIGDRFPPVTEDRYMQPQIVALQKGLIDSGALYKAFKKGLNL